MRILVVNGNKIEIDMLSVISGTETIYYNGDIVSQKKSITGSTHTFSVNENGEEVTYNIKVGLGLPVRSTVVITRNGELLYSDEKLGNAHGLQI
ncbi:MAG: hypothetical protein EBZ77_08495 [Chitinophagia bacterium]|nr:hypothetical protein [Chitinophagia bacterium]